jgi:hypothetical protein
MPEQLTKHPEVTLQVLQSAGARCGTGAPQEILKTCPSGSFCKLPGGEMCVYGLPQAGGMSQVSRAEWAQVAQTVGVAPAAPAAAGGMGALPAAGMGFLAGVVVAWLLLALLRRGS